MDTTAIIEGLTRHTGAFPREALMAAQERRAEIAPLLLGVIEMLIERTPELSKDTTYMLHLYAMYLLAEFRETRAYPLVVELMRRHGDDPDQFFGETIASDLDRILVSVCGGDATLIKQLVEDPKVDEYVRTSALRALNLLIHTGATTRDDAVAYLRWLLTGGFEREPSHAWDEAVCCAIELHPGELVEVIRQAYDDGLVWPGYVGFDEVKKAAKERQDVVIERYKEQNPSYIGNIVAEMEWWEMFKAEERVEDVELAKPVPRPKPKSEPKPEPVPALEEPQVPVPAKKEKVGRNEPCPCGSGKKYKKCCGR